MSCRLRCLVLSEAECEDTDTSPKCIIPQKAQVIIAQLHTSNGLSGSRVTHRADRSFVIALKILQPTKRPVYVCMIIIR